MSLLHCQSVQKWTTIEVDDLRGKVGETGAVWTYFTFSNIKSIWPHFQSERNKMLTDWGVGLISPTTKFFFARVLKNYHRFIINWQAGQNEHSRADWTLTFLWRKIASEEHNKLKWLQTHSETSIKYLGHLLWTINESAAHQYISGQNEHRGRMNIAHNMFILPRDPMFVLPRLGSFKLLQDHSITPRTIVKLLL